MRYLLRRVGFYLIALWASVTLNFIIPRLMPGDPALAFLARMQGKNVTFEQLQAIRTLFGVQTNVPIWVQYGQYLNNLLHGNLGISDYFFPQTVMQVIGEHLPWTLGLLSIAVIISFLLGTLIGIVIGWKRGSWLDNILPPVLTFLSAIPYFWMALALVYLLGLVLNWFPIGDAYDAYSTTPGLSLDFITSVIQHGILPVFTIVVASLAGWVLPMRNTMITTLSEDYVLMAQAKGLSQGRVMYRYAARNAILPSITSFSMSLGLIVGGSLLTEIVFNYPGIGIALLAAVGNNDYSLVEACFLFIAITVLAANFLSDILNALLDPRVRQGRS
jgi:peptide/nickel transport system permease protein